MTDKTYFVSIAVRKNKGAVLTNESCHVLQFNPMERIDELSNQLVNMREELLKRDAQIEETADLIEKTVDLIEEMGDLIDRQSNEIDEMRPVYNEVGAVSHADLKYGERQVLARIFEAFMGGAQ